DQVGSRNRAEVTQGDAAFGGSKFAKGTITQSGNDNYAEVAQYGNVGSYHSSNSYTLTQDGEFHTVFGWQEGKNHSAMIDQDGTAQDLEFEQYGNNNSIDV